MVGSADPFADPMLAVADRVRNLRDVDLPTLKYWNYDPCEDHTELTRGCKKCGGTFRRHQRVGITWMYFRKRGLLADPVGLGKTIHGIGLCCLLKERGELTDRALVIVRPAAIQQWKDEFTRFAPRLHVETIEGPKSRRIEKYSSNADVFIIGYQMLLRDIDTLMRLQPQTIISDDVDPLRNYETQTARDIKRLFRQATRAYHMSGTPIQIHLQEIYSIVEELGGREVFGSPSAFEHRHVRMENQIVWSPKGKKISKRVPVGYKNMNEFKKNIQPFFLRRTRADVDDADIPELITEDVWLDLYPRQREKYAELQRGILTLLTEGGDQITRTVANAKLQTGAQICAGLSALGEPDGPETSAKLDWLMRELEPGGDLDNEKAVIFCQFKNSIRAVHARLEAAGIQYVTIWGDERDSHIRKERQRAFTEDPEVRVCIGTSAMEQSLNLQAARVLINVDMLMNPRRMEQLSGRIQRDGSLHRNVYVYNLLTPDTQEARYLPVLQQRQAIGDFVFGETSELFEQLSPFALLQLIKP